MLTDKQLEEARITLLRAYDMVRDLCQGRRQWMMSIPARPDYDPDLVIADGLSDGQRLWMEVAQLRQENLTLRTWMLAKMPPPESWTPSDDPCKRDHQWTVIGRNDIVCEVCGARGVIGVWYREPEPTPSPIKAAE